MLVEDNGFVVAHENFIGKDQVEGLGQHNFFHIPARSDHISHGVGVIHLDHILGNDGSLVQVVTDKVCRGPDNFHSPFKSLPVRISPDKGGQEGMMNIDDAVRESFNCFSFPQVWV